MNRISIHKNRLIWSYWAGKFAMSASDADFLIRFGNKQVAFVGNHKHCLCGARFRAGTACCLLCFDNTIILNEIYLPDLRQLLGFKQEGLKGIRWTDLGTDCTVVGAEALVIIHYRHHESGDTELPDCRYDHLIGAGADAERTGGAILHEIAERPRAWRADMISSRFPYGGGFLRNRNILLL